MLQFCRQHWWRLHVRRAFTGVALIAYLAAALGFPLPAVAAKDRSVPFPCMDHACGCLNAEQCWRHCCCFTPEQKLAWAAAHGIVPPPHAEQPDAQPALVADLSWVPQDPATDSGGCSHGAGQTSSCHQPSSACHHQEHSGCPKPACQTQAAQKKASSRWVLGLFALGCRGSSAAWAATGAALTPPPPVTWRPAWPLAGRLPFAFLCQALFTQYPLDRPPRPVLS
jgi:hypothetical protein